MADTESLKTGVSGGVPWRANDPKASGPKASDPKASGPVVSPVSSPSPEATAVTPPAGLQFPGCKPVHLPSHEIETYESRLEFWDADTEIAWVCEPSSPYHEEPAETLSALVERIASVRGSPIKRYGSMDLLLRNSRGERWRIMQADQSLYLHPAHAHLPGASAMVIGEHDFPDVVLEVDHTTDVRRGKLGLYESWGFPEVWVEVPERRAPSRRRGRLPGLTIHVLEDGAYRTVPESPTFPGWTAEEIHEAMNETVASARTHAILERTGAALGAREGTGPDDDPLLRSQRRQGFERGRMEGRAKLVRQMLLSRGVAVSEEFPRDVPRFPESSEAVVVAAALECDSEADFRARLRQRGD